MALAVTLASGSASRRALLAAAGVAADAVSPNVDEEAYRTAMRADGLPVRDQAMQLAEMKALRVSQSRTGLVIGGDQMLALGDEAFDKPRDLSEARRHLERLSGKSHTLETAIVVCEDGRPVWRHLARPKLTMRPCRPNSSRTIPRAAEARSSPLSAPTSWKASARSFSPVSRGTISRSLACRSCRCWTISVPGRS
jgi:predicted house-cleaning NTP pyrophosphatase (Maf/HAM1 superfamily)